MQAEKYAPQQDVCNLWRTDRILGLLKFGQKVHIDSLVHGTLYMNTLQYFASVEEEEKKDLRGDSFEGVGRLIQADGGVLSAEVQGTFQPFSRIAGPILWRPTDGIRANVFCMYALREPTGPQFIDPQNFRFGDAFAIFTDGNEFLRRVRNSAQAASLSMRDDLVKYVNENEHEGEMGIFRKRSRFAFQSEYRIAIIPGIQAPYRLQVGDLSDITITGPLHELNTLLRSQPAG